MDFASFDSVRLCFWCNVAAAAGRRVLRCVMVAAEERAPAKADISCAIFSGHHFSALAPWTQK
jgi:hypothetical protein